MGLLRLTPSGPGETSRPAADRLIAGDPVQTTWVAEAREGLWAGVWECTPGAWRVAYDEWEYCRILAGVSIVAGEDGTQVVLRAGDSLVLRPGFRGSWKVRETTRKEFVVLSPPPPAAAPGADRPG